MGAYTQYIKSLFSPQSLLSTIQQSNNPTLPSQPQTSRKAELNHDVDIARIAASRQAEAQDEDLKREVEIKRAAAEVERLRTSDAVKVTIAREAKQQAADARAYEIEVDAKAGLIRNNVRIGIWNKLQPLG